MNFLVSYKIPVQTHKLQSVTLTLNAQNITNWHYYNYRYNSEYPRAAAYTRSFRYMTSGLIGAAALAPAGSRGEILRALKESRRREPPPGHVARA